MAIDSETGVMQFRVESSDVSGEFVALAPIPLPPSVPPTSQAELGTSSQTPHVVAGDAEPEPDDSSARAGSSTLRATGAMLHLGDDVSVDGLPALADPTISHQDRELELRRADVNEKHQRIIAWLDKTGYEAVLLGRTDSVGWFTAGGDLAQTLTSELSAALVLVNRHCRALICDNVQTARLFEEEVAGLGFQLKERPWRTDPFAFALELARDKKYATDCGLFGWPNELSKLKALRLSLTRQERRWMRELGRTLARQVEATCRNFEPGETEADIAGHLAHRLIRQGIVPVDLRVAADGRLERYRQPRFKSARVTRHAVIQASGRRHGLCASVARMVAFDPVDPELARAHALASMVDATLIYFSRPGAVVSDIFRRARRIYEKYGHPHEWMKDYQGHVVGVSPRELTLTPDGQATLGHDLALSWCPSVSSARSQDTIVIDQRGYEVVTESRRWPRVEVLVKNLPILRPGLLIRKP